MAYAVPCSTACFSTSCPKRAVVEIFNRYNANQGQFCARHGNQKLKELQKAESDPKTFPRPRVTHDDA